MPSPFARNLSALAAAALLAACASGPEVTRLDPPVQVDLTDRWNATDSRLVAEAMMDDMLDFPWLEDFRADSGRDRPRVIVHSIRNRSHEHIPVDTFINDLRRELIRSGLVDFVAAGDEREDIREERRDQDSVFFEIGATDGKSFQQMAGSMTGMSEEEYRNMMVAGGRDPTTGDNSQQPGDPGHRGLDTVEWLQQPQDQILVRYRGGHDAVVGAVDRDGPQVRLLGTWFEQQLLGVGERQVEIVVGRTELPGDPAILLQQLHPDRVALQRNPEVTTHGLPIGERHRHLGDAVDVGHRIEQALVDLGQQRGADQQPQRHRGHHDRQRDRHRRQPGQPSAQRHGASTGRSV
jgi:hypothetical protein